MWVKIVGAYLPDGDLRERDLSPAVTGCTADNIAGRIVRRLSKVRRAADIARVTSKRELCVDDSSFGGRCGVRMLAGGFPRKQMSVVGRVVGDKRAQKTAMLRRECRPLGRSQNPAM